MLGGEAGTGGGSTRTQGTVYVFVEPATGWAGAQSQSAELTAGAGAPIIHTAYVLDPGATATITTPANGATYTQGQPLAATYACTASGPATLSSCMGTLAPGAAVDTSVTGTHTFSVTATAGDGVIATTTSTYTIAPPAPSLGPLHNAHRRFRDGSKLATIATVRHRLPVGTTFKFTLNTAATLALTFTKINAKCTKHKHHCKRTSGAGTLTLPGHAGANKITFQGRLTKHHKLKPGIYKLSIVATNTTGHSKTRTAKFTIVTP